MMQIIKSRNNYYVKTKDGFYGPFHSVADAETTKLKASLKLEKPLTHYNFLKTIY
jgi:hypothetical protein